MQTEIEKNIQLALSLKLQNLTHTEVAARMGRPVGTIKRWLAPYKEQWQDRITQLAKDNAQIASLKNKAKCDKLKQDAYDEAYRNAEEDLKDELLRDFVNLYVGEGSRTADFEVAITNSDPKVIFLSVYIIKKYFQEENKKISFTIKYYEANNNGKELLDYWKNLLRNENDIEFKTYLQKRKNNETHNNSNKFGLVLVRIFDTYAKQRVNAYMDYLKAEWQKKFEQAFDTKVDQNIKQVHAVKKDLNKN